MQRYRFIVFDEHKLIVEKREFPANDDQTAILVAAGWRDVRGGQVWRESKLIKHWRYGAGASFDPARRARRRRDQA